MAAHRKYIEQNRETEVIITQHQIVN